jgi:hypothetical protein
MGKLVVRIKIPRGTRRARVRVIRGGRPRYVSASTAAMTMAIAAGSKTVLKQTVPLTPTSPGCTSSPSGTVCTTTVALKACPSAANCYTATVSTYDAVFCNGAPPVCSIPVGANELSTAQNIPFGVAAGKPNSISLTLSSVPHSVNISPDALTRANGETFDLIGPGAHVFTAQALDADGNIIVGPGAPAFKATPAIGGLPVTVAVPSTAPDQIWVTPPATFDGADTATFDVTPTFAGQATNGCAEPQAVCSPTSVTVDMEQMYAIADTTLTYYALDESTPRLSANYPAGAGIGLAADTSGDIFAPGGVAAIYAPPLSSGSPTTPACCPGSTSAVAAGANGFAYFLTSYPTAAGSQNVVSRCSPSACATTLFILPYNTNQVFAADAAGDIAYGNPNLNNSQTCFAYVYSAPSYGAPTKIFGNPLSATGCAMRVALDPNGNLFASDPNNSQIVEYSKASGYQTATRILGTPTPMLLFTDSSGDLFDVSSTGGIGGGATVQETLAASLNANQGGSLGPDHSASLFPSGYFQGVAAAFGPDGLYVEYYSYGGSVTKPMLAGYALPGLTPLGPQLTNQSYSPQGLVVLP